MRKVVQNFLLFTEQATAVALRGDTAAQQAGRQRTPENTPPSSSCIAPFRNPDTLLNHNMHLNRNDDVNNSGFDAGHPSSSIFAPLSIVSTSSFSSIQSSIQVLHWRSKLTVRSQLSSMEAVFVKNPESMQLQANSTMQLGFSRRTTLDMLQRNSYHRGTNRARKGEIEHHPRGSE